MSSVRSTSGAMRIVSTPASRCRCECRLAAMTDPRPARLSVLIVDDEAPARARLRSLVEACTDPPTVVVGEAADAFAAIEALHEMRCDAVLLDIGLPGRDGLKLADELRRLPLAPAVVFVTAHAEHALRAFDLEAVDYLTKPVRRERLQAALLRLAQRRPAQAEASTATATLVVSDRGRVLRVPAGDMVYLKAELKYVTLRTDSGSWVLDDALSDLEPRLGPGFIRIHRNAIVALRAVRALERRLIAGDGGEAWGVLLGNGEWLEVSRRQLAQVREVLTSGAAPGDNASGAPPGPR
jgi:two-component system response regulator AlgR